MRKLAILLSLSAFLTGLYGCESYHNEGIQEQQESAADQEKSQDSTLYPTPPEHGGNAGNR